MNQIQSNIGKSMIGKITVVLLACVLIVLNFLPLSGVRYDLTDAELYSVSVGTRKYLKELDRDVTVYVFDADGSNPRFEAFLETLDACGRHVRLKNVKSEKSADLLAKAGVNYHELNDQTKATLKYCVMVESDARATMIDYYSMMQYVNSNTNLSSFLGSYIDTSYDGRMSYSEYQTYYYYLYQMAQQNTQYQEYLYYLIEDSTLYFQGEGMIVSMIEYAAKDIIPAKYVLTGHGEPALSEILFGDMLSTFGQASYEALDLSATGSVPRDAAAILMLLPQTDYSEGEIASLRAYLNEGGTMNVVVGDANLTATPNLIALFAEYGIQIEAGTVRQKIEVTVEGTEDSGEPVTEWQESNTVEVIANTDHPALRSVASEKGLAPEITNGNAILCGEGAVPILTTSAEAYVGTEEAKGARVVAAATDGSKGARLVVFTGGDSFTASLASYQTYHIYNDFCLLVAMDWTDLIYESAVGTPDAKVYESPVLETTQTGVIAFGIVTVFAIPVALLVFGAIVVYKRRVA